MKRKYYFERADGSLKCWVLGITLSEARAALKAMLGLPSSLGFTCTHTRWVAGR